MNAAFRLPGIAVAPTRPASRRVEGAFVERGKTSTDGESGGRLPWKDVVRDGRLDATQGSLRPGKVPVGDRVDAGAKG
jgi:hypothetical protein